MLGAGVMGAQIAAHCVNAKVPVVLFDLPAPAGPKNGHPFDDVFLGTGGGDVFFRRFRRAPTEG